MSEVSSGLERRALKGLAWSGGSQVVGQVVRTIVAVTLARLLAPDDYGLAMLAVMFASLVLVFSDLALGAAIIQRPVLTEDDRSTVFWMAVCAGTAFTAAGVALADPIAIFYGRAEVAPLCIALSATFIIVSLGTTHEAILIREMEFGRLERRTMVATVVGAVTGIVVAVTTRSPWAIIAQLVADAMASTTLLWAFSPWRPSWRFSRRSLRELGGFSGYLVGHRLLYYAHRNTDNLLIGKFIGAAALGVYSLAYNIMLFPFSRIAGAVQKVLAPAFARMQDDKAQLADSWTRAVRLLGTLAVPALFGMIVVAPEFVRVVLGPQWAETTPILQVLAWVGIVQSLQSLNTDVLQALGLTSKVFRFSIIFTTAHLLAFVIGLQWGVIGVAAAYAISTTLVEPIYTVMTARAVGISPWRLLAAVRGVFEAGVLMAVTVFATRELLVTWGVSTAARLIACIAVGAAAFLPAYMWREPAGSAEIRRLAHQHWPAGARRRRRPQWRSRLMKPPPRHRRARRRVSALREWPSRMISSIQGDIPAFGSPQRNDGVASSFMASMIEDRPSGGGTQSEQIDFQRLGVNDVHSARHADADTGFGPGNPLWSRQVPRRIVPGSHRCQRPQPRPPPPPSSKTT